MSMTLDERLLQSEQSGDTLHLRGTGRWDVAHLVALERALGSAGERQARIDLDLSSLEALDTAGAWVLVSALQAFQNQGIDTVLHGLKAEHRILLDEVASHRSDQEPEPRQFAWPIKLLEDIGRTVVEIGPDFSRVMSFFGAVVEAWSNALFKPWRFRFTSFVFHLEHVGLRAVPIVALMSLLMGGIIAQQGAFQLRKFGAELFVVDMVGILVLREIGLALTAIMFAGRSGSAFTAEIGSMKMREEIDALRIMGLDPIETLVLPRLSALVVALPAVTFLADLMCLLGAGLVCKYYVDIPPDVFLTRLREAVGLNTFLVGLIKAPFMAMVIGLIACVEGMKVKGSAESLGRHTTAAVVRAIFVVIVLDGFFAIFFAAVDW